MLSNFFGKKEEKHEEEEKEEKNSPDVILAMVALKEASLPAAADIQKFFYDEFSERIDLEKTDDDEYTRMFEYKGEMLFYSLMPAPIPWEELEGPCATAWYWPEAAQEMKKHAAHIIVSMLPNQDSDLAQIDRAIILSKVVAAILHNTDSVGVYWGSGTVVSPKDTFIQGAKAMEKDSLPIELWIDLRIQQTEKGSFQFFTTGMKAFGHMEIEIRDTKQNPRDIFSFMYNTIAYLLDNGPVIKDGDTIGGDENQRIIVRYDTSLWDAAEKVMVVEW